MTNTKRLIVIAGATGSGKTDLALVLAEHYGAPVVSTDSRQFYRGMAIGTAQPTAEQLARAPHYFISTNNIDEEMNCGSYETAALALLERLFAQHDTVVAAGGSGLYIKALCEGLDDLPHADKALRDALAQRMRTEGVEALAAQLQALDPEYFAKVDRRNPARVQRALEVCLQTGRPYSSFRTGRRRKRDFTIIKIGIDMPREVLYERINRRVEAMMADGLEDEARALYPFRTANALQTVGYKELFEYFDGNISRAEAVELIKRNTRRYAKRQMTWFRRDERMSWFDPAHVEDVENYIDRFVE